MNYNVEPNQFLKTKPDFNPNKDGPEIKLIQRGKTNTE